VAGPSARRVACDVVEARVVKAFDEPMYVGFLTCMKGEYDYLALSIYEDTIRLRENLGLKLQECILHIRSITVTPR
jgi:hypothetical protein